MAKLTWISTSNELSQFTVLHVSQGKLLRFVVTSNAAKPTVDLSDLVPAMNRLICTSGSFHPMHVNVRCGQIGLPFGLAGLWPMFPADLDGGPKECARWKVSKTLLWKLHSDVGWEQVQRPKSSSRTVWSQIHFQQHVLVSPSLREWMAASHRMN